MAKKTITFNVDEPDLIRLDEYAANLGRNRTYVLNHAVRMYIATVEAEEAEDDEAEASIERGEVIPHEEVVREFEREFERRRRKAS